MTARAHPAPASWLLLPGIAAGGLYLTTLAPSLLWGDSAGLQLRAYLGEFHAGALGHPLWVLAAHLLIELLPGADPARLANLLSALGGAATVLFVALIIYHQSQSLSGAALGAGALAVSHTFWLHAVITEVYTFHLALISAAAWLLLAGRQRAAWFLVGLSLSAHLLTLPLLPAFLYLTIDRRAPRRALGPAVAAGLGLLPFAYWELTAPPLGGGSPGPGILEALLAPAFWQQSPRYLGLAAAYGGYQFLLSAPAGLWGLKVSWGRSATWFWLLWLLGSAGFAFYHRVPDQYVFYLPAWLAVAVFCGLGYQDLLARLRPRWRWPGLLLAALVAWGAPAGAYRLAAEVGANAGAIVPLRAIPYRPAARYFLWPPKADQTGAGRYANEVLSGLPSGAALLADWTLYAPLAYAQRVDGRRPDVELVDIGALPVPQPEFLLAQPPGRPLYLADVNSYYALAAIAEHFEIRPEGLLYALARAGSP